MSEETTVREFVQLECEKELRVDVNTWTCQPKLTTERLAIQTSRDLSVLAARTRNIPTRNKLQGARCRMAVGYELSGGNCQSIIATRASARRVSLTLDYRFLFEENTPIKGYSSGLFWRVQNTDHRVIRSARSPSRSTLHAAADPQRRSRSAAFPPRDQARGWPGTATRKRLRSESRRPMDASQMLD